MKNRGFTLIELMIVVVIIGILAAVAYPSYRNYVRKANRTDGMTALSNLQLAQNKLRGNCPYYAGQFTSGISTCGADAANSTVQFKNTDANTGQSNEGYYVITLASPSATGFVATATAQGDQANDKEQGVSCSPLVLTVSNTYPDGNITPDECE